MRDIDGAYFLPEGNAFRNPDTFVPIYRSLFSPMQQELSIPKGFPPVPQAEDSWLVRGAYLLFLRTARVLFAGSAMYATINGPYTIMSVLAASMGCIFGLGEQEGWRRRWLDWRAWPDIFGGLRENDWGHGIFSWWGTAWHGLFKNVTLQSLVSLFLLVSLVTDLLDYSVLSLPEEPSSLHLACRRTAQQQQPYLS